MSSERNSLWNAYICLMCSHCCRMALERWRAISNIQNETRWKSQLHAVDPNSIIVSFQLLDWLIWIHNNRFWMLSFLISVHAIEHLLILIGRHFFSLQAENSIRSFISVESNFSIENYPHGLWNIDCIDATHREASQQFQSQLVSILLC